MKFRQRVYSVVQGVPPGRVVSYGDVARAVGMPGHARQVGRALAALGDSEADVPWHRVVRSTGAIAFGEGTEAARLQEILLAREGIALTSGRVSMAHLRWCPPLDIDPSELGRGP